MSTITTLRSLALALTLTLPGAALTAHAAQAGHDRAGQRHSDVRPTAPVARNEAPGHRGRGHRHGPGQGAVTAPRSAHRHHDGGHQEGHGGRATGTATAVANAPAAPPVATQTPGPDDTGSAGTPTPEDGDTAETVVTPTADDPSEAVETPASGAAGTATAAPGPETEARRRGHRGGSGSSHDGATPTTTSGERATATPGAATRPGGGSGRGGDAPHGGSEGHGGHGGHNG